jgi:hypothetical protein
MRRRFFLWAFWVFLLIGVAWARAWVFRPGTHHPGSYFNRGRNAAWIGVEWAREPHPAQAIAALAHDLRRRQIRYVFVYTSYLRPDGTFNPTFAHLADFVSQLRRAYPLLHIQAWIGLPLEYVDLSDAATREKIVWFCVNVVRTTGVDGIHLDPEPVPTDEENVLLLLDELREALGARGPSPSQRGGSGRSGRMGHGPWSGASPGGPATTGRWPGAWIRSR